MEHGNNTESTVTKRKDSIKNIKLRKFINSRESIITSTIKQIKLLKSLKHPTLRSLLPSNCLYLPPSSEKKIAIFTGDSSGHEPYPISYVSPYFLNTAIVGGIFSTPPISDIINALYHSGKDSSGILMIINNYQGNNLCFGLAAMKAKSAGEELWDDGSKVPIESLKVADDCSFLDFHPSDKFGYLGESWREKARGLTGVVYISKVLGYWSQMWVEDPEALKRYKEMRGIGEEEEFDQLMELKRLGEDMMKEGGLLTMASSLSSCGRFSEHENQEIFSKEGEVEVGIGIHGGAGKSVLEYENVNQIVNIMVRNIKNAIEATNPNGLIKRRYAFMVNNLGSVTELEMSTIVESVKYYLKIYGFNIDYFSKGKFMTSLDTNGFSITVFEIKEDIKDILIEALKFETDTPFNFQENPKELGVEEDDESEMEIDNYKKLDPMALSEDKCPLIVGKRISRILRRVFKLLAKSERYLNKIDLRVGDGDLGESVADAIKEILPYVDFTRQDGVSLSQALNQFSELFGQYMRGTSGPLYSAFILGVAEILAENENFDQEILRKALNRGNLKVKELGKAEYSERTMLYVLHKIDENWDFSVFDEEKLKNFKIEVEGYCNEVKNILPSKGMSRFLGERCLGNEDPGCEMVKIWTIRLAELIHEEFFAESSDE